MRTYTRFHVDVEAPPPQEGDRIQEDPNTYDRPTVWEIQYIIDPPGRLSLYYCRNLKVDGTLGAYERWFTFQPNTVGGLLEATVNISSSDTNDEQ